MTYSVDYQIKVLEMREEEGLTMKEVASRFDIGDATVTCWVKRVVPQANCNKPATKMEREAACQRRGRKP